MIQVPSDWAGMQNTIYKFVVTVISQNDPSQPQIKNELTVEQTVIATKESMTRYILHEIEELIEEIKNANAQGINTGGLLPIALHPALQKANQALELILSSRINNASNALSSNVKIMEAFIRALDGFNGKGDKIPASIDSDWRERANAVIQDLEIAAANTVISAD